jgi:hypothetical protein
MDSDVSAEPGPTRTVQFDRTVLCWPRNSLADETSMTGFWLSLAGSPTSTGSGGVGSPVFGSVSPVAGPGFRIVTR